MRRPAVIVFAVLVAALIVLLVAFLAL